MNFQINISDLYCIFQININFTNPIIQINCAEIRNK